MIKSLISNLFNRHKGKDGEIPKRYIQQYLPEYPVIIEAGAHIGIDTLEMAELWPESIIHAFEPVPEIFQQLRNNTESYSNIKCNKMALSAVSGDEDLYISSGASDGSSSLLQPKEHLNIHPEVFFDKKIRIQTTTLDEWSEINNVHSADLLWLDLQGAELKVLKSGVNLLESVAAIHTEVSLIENYQGGELYSDLKNWLESMGFAVAREEIPWKDMGNVLFIRKTIKHNGGRTDLSPDRFTDRMR